MTTTLAPAPHITGPARRDAGGRAPAAGPPGLTVLCLPPGQMPLAGYLLRHGPALTLVEMPPDPVPMSAAAAGMWPMPTDLVRRQEESRAAADRALEASANAGFAVDAVETLVPGGLADRLRSLDGSGIGCVVVTGRGPREVRRLARAAGAPVLAVPAGAAPAGGPAVLDAADVERAAAAVARALATEHAVVLAPDDDGTGAVQVARRHGLDATPLAATGKDAGVRAAAAREGILVVADRGGRRTPRALRRALAARRPVLVVPTS